MNCDTKIPDNFVKLIKDFIIDIIKVFPEYKDNLNTQLNDIYINDISNINIKYINEIYNISIPIYAERFFDILYKRDDIFKDDNINTCFLPGIDFKDIWNDNISDNTRNIIWNYLQLILFSIVENTDDKNNFGETSKLFEAIDEEELKNKLQDTIDEIGNMFNINNSENKNEDFNNLFNMDLSDNVLPNIDNINENINKLLGGTLGKLAKEIAKEATDELKDEIGDVTDIKDIGDVFKKMFNNPTKLLSIIKNLGNKLDEKIKSGEINEKEILEETNNLMSNMQNMPGMKNMEQIFKKMGLNKNGKLNMNQVQSNMKKQMNMNKMKARMLKKLQKRNNMKSNEEIKKDNNITLNEEIIKNNHEYVLSSFKIDEEPILRSTKRKKRKKRKKNKKNK